LAAAAALWCAGCDQLALGPPPAASAPSAPAAASAPRVDPQLSRHAGETYSNFVAASGAAYAPDALGLAAADRARLWRGMARGATGTVISGGGAQALVFSGCADTGCTAGAAIVAIDAGTGGVFVGVRDVGGADVLTPNDRVEALLRLHSPTRSWEDPVLAENQTEAPAHP
jgi:hypothetical protein